jgi:hypothetical protein
MDAAPLTHAGTETFLNILNGINIGVWVLSILFLINAFQFAVDAFGASPHGRKQTGEGLGHLIARMFMHMWSQGDVYQLLDLSVPSPVGTATHTEK